MSQILQVCAPCKSKEALFGIIFASAEHKERSESCDRDKGSELKGIKVPKPTKDINRELKWSFKS